MNYFFKKKDYNFEFRVLGNNKFEIENLISLLITLNSLLLFFKKLKINKFYFKQVNLIVVDEFGLIFPRFNSNC